MNAAERAERIAEVEQEILARDGYLTVANRYYAREADYRFWLRIEAEKIVDREERAARRADLETMTPLGRQMTLDIERWQAAMRSSVRRTPCDTR